MAKVVSDKGKHLKFRDGLGHQISAPKTTSDFRAIKNFESELKGRGFHKPTDTEKGKRCTGEGIERNGALPTKQQTQVQSIGKQRSKISHESFNLMFKDQKGLNYKYRQIIY